MQIGEQFREKVEALNLEHKYSSATDCVTISIGIAACTPKIHSNPEDLLKAADNMLYEAKESGRNCVSGCSLDG